MGLTKKRVSGFQRSLARLSETEATRVGERFLAIQRKYRSRHVEMATGVSRHLLWQWVQDGLLIHSSAGTGVPRLFTAREIAGIGIVQGMRKRGFPLPDCIAAAKHFLRIPKWSLDRQLMAGRRYLVCCGAPINQPDTLLMHSEIYGGENFDFHSLFETGLPVAVFDVGAELSRIAQILKSDDTPPLKVGGLKLPAHSPTGSSSSAHGQCLKVNA